MSVVATGTRRTVSRRIAVTFKTTTKRPRQRGPDRPDEVEIDNNADARVGVGTNGDIYVHNNGNVCGNIRHGIGKKATFENNGTQCAGYAKPKATWTLPPVSSFMPTDIATNNSNYRLAHLHENSPIKTPVGCQTDTYNGKWTTGTLGRQTRGRSTSPTTRP